MILAGRLAGMNAYTYVYMNQSRRLRLRPWCHNHHNHNHDRVIRIMIVLSYPMRLDRRSIQPPPCATLRLRPLPRPARTGPPRDISQAPPPSLDRAGQARPGQDGTQDRTQARAGSRYGYALATDIPCIYPSLASRHIGDD